MKNLIHIFIVITLIISSYSCGNLFSTKDGNENLSLVLSYNSELYQGSPELFQQIISDRLLAYGLNAEQFSIKLNKNQIEVNVRKVANAGNLADLITREGKLEFWETYECKEILNAIMISNDKIPFKKMENNAAQNADNESQSAKSGEFNYEAVKKESNVDSSQLYTYFRPNIIMNENQQYEAGYGAVVGIANILDTFLISHYFQTKEVSDNFPRDLQFMWGMKPPVYANGEKLLELFSIKAFRGESVLNGSFLSGVRIENGKKGVSMTFDFNNEGTGILRRFTQNNINRSIAISLDKSVISCGNVLEMIENGKMELSGNGLNMDETEIIAAIINGGYLPIKLKIVSKKIDGK